MKPVQNYLEDNPVFAVIGLLLVIAALAGAVVCAVNPDALTFDQYLDSLSKFAIGLGVYAIGKGILHGGASIADAVQPPPLPINVPPTVNEAEAEAAFQEAAVAPGGPAIDHEGETQSFRAQDPEPPPV